MFTYLEQVLISYANHVHLAVFAPAVSFIEEIIPPIPSPSVMIATGAMAQVQGYLFYGLLLLALLGAIGKTLGASSVYFIVDKIEDLFSSRIGSYLGITHEQIEGFGSRLKGRWSDYLILIFLRSIPIVPSTVISIGSGLLKINRRLFIISTLVGSFVRDFIYIYVGYTGAKVAISYFKGSINNLESIIGVIIVSICFVFLIYLYFKRKKSV